MKKTLKILGILATLCIGLSVHSAHAQLRVLRGAEGGTGIGAATGGDVGSCLKVLTSTPFTYTLGTCGSGSGGESSGGTWSTTTSPVAGELINYPNNSTDIVVIGARATSSAPYFFDPNTLTSVLNGLTTVNRITATGTIASIFPYASTTALTTSGQANIGTLLLTNALTVANGGTGAQTLTGCLTGNGTGAITGSGTCNTSNATVSSVAASVPSFLSIAGSPITTSGTLAITYSGTALPILNGGTGLTAVGASSTVLITNGSANFYQKLATSQLTNDSGFLTATSTLTNNNTFSGVNQFSNAASTSFAGPISFTYASSTATSTLAGINLPYGGCFAVAGVCLTSGSGGSGYTTIQDEGSNLTARATLNFIGAGVTCVDDSGNTRTNCTVTSGGGSGAAGTWASTTSNVPSELVNYSSAGAGGTTATDIVTIGGSSTTTAPFYFDPSVSGSPSALQVGVGTLGSNIRTQFNAGGSSFRIVGKGNSTSIFLVGGDATTSSQGGAISITAGVGSTTQAGGSVNISGGGASSDANGSGLGGTVTISGGSASANNVSGVGGNVKLVSGSPGASPNWGNIIIDSGASTGANAGNIQLLHGLVGIATTSPYASLSVVGSSGVVADHYTATSSTATSTFAAGIDAKTICIQGTTICLSPATGGGSGTVGSGVTGQLAFYNSSGTSVQGSSTQSLTIGQLFATSTATSTFGGPVSLSLASTTATSTLAGINLPYGGCVAVAGVCLTSNTGTVTSVATNAGLTGGTITGAGTIGLDTTGILNGAILQYNGTRLVATGTPSLTIGYLIATSTTATSTFANTVSIGSSTPSGNQLFSLGSTTATALTYDKNTGFIGIGSTSPTSPFTIIQSGGLLTTALAIDGASAGAGAEMALNRANTSGTEANIDFNTAGVEEWQLGIQNNNTNNFEIWDGNDSPFFTINQGNGDVGIGTSTPYSELTVWGEPGTNLLELVNNASSTKVTVDQNGNFGLGSTSPGSIFAIQNILNAKVGTSTWQGGGIDFVGGGCVAMNGVCIGGGTGGGGSGTVGSGVTGQLAFYNSSGTSIVGSSSASVTVGSLFATSTTATSTVAGGLIVGNNCITFDPSVSTTTMACGVVTGNSIADNDAGLETFYNLPVVSAAFNTPEGYDLQIGNQTALQIKCLAGIAGCQAIRVGIGTTSPYAQFEIFASSTNDNLFQVVSAASTTLDVINSTGLVGIGTSSPYANLSVTGTTGDLFAIATSSSGRLYSIDSVGHQFTSGSAGTCDANCTFISGDDNTFYVKTGTAITSTVYTFANSWGGIWGPVCLVGDGAAVTTFVDASSTPTSVTLTPTTALTNTILGVSCRGHK